MTSRSVQRHLLPVVLAVVFVAIGSRGASAAPCLPGSLTDYLGLGGGCSIGSVQFDNFALIDLPTSATAISPDVITVAPLSSASSVGFVFTLDVDAGAGDLFEVLFGYDVSGASVNAGDLAMTGASATGDGVVTAVEDLCVGAAFNPGINCPAQHEANITFAIEGDELLAMSTPFGATALLGVVNDFAVDGGLFGTGTLIGSVTNQFALAAPAAVPEPSTSWLLVAGLVQLVRSRSVRKRL